VVRRLGFDEAWVGEQHSAAWANIPDPAGSRTRSSRTRSIVGTPDDMIAALHRLQEATGGFGGFMVLAYDWASHEATLRSYELIARRVMPELRRRLAPLPASYAMVAANKRSYGAPAMAAIRKAYDAGETVPDGMDPGRLR